MPYAEAIRFVLDRNPAPGEWDAATWTQQADDVKFRGFFSAKVESYRFLDRAQGLIFDYMTGVRDDVTTPDGEKTTALRIGDRADFVRRMREFMAEEGMISEDEMMDVNQGDVRQLSSETRLRLIFDTNVRQAYGYGAWKQGQEPKVKEAFPAARLVRDKTVTTPRPRHQSNLGEVRDKDDGWWSTYINSPEIGGFGNPWGPYGYNSGVTQEDVSKAEWERMKKPKAAPESAPVPETKPEAAPEEESRVTIDPSLLDGARAKLASLDPDIRKRLLRELQATGDERVKIIEENNEARAKRIAEGRPMFLDPEMERRAKGMQ